MDEARRGVATAAPPTWAAYTQELTRTYGRGESAVHALAGVTVAFERQRITAVMGPSGSGKSTLMQCMAGLDAPTSGRVVLATEDGGVELSRLSAKALTVLRRRRLGFVFQAFNLVPTLTAEENITLTARLGGGRYDPEWFATLTGALGLRDRLRHRPSQLSGGQQQRVAVARALLTRPEVVFADEPTGNLDSTASGEVLRFLRAAADSYGQTVVLVTHDPFAAAHADRVVFLGDGRVVGELADPTSDRILASIKELEGDSHAA